MTHIDENHGQDLSGSVHAGSRSSNGADSDELDRMKRKATKSDFGCGYYHPAEASSRGLMITNKPKLKRKRKPRLTLRQRFGR